MREKRKTARKPYSVPAFIKTLEKSWHTKTRDISCDGVFIISTNYPSIGAEVEVSLALPGLAAKLKGIVRWVSKDGFGVQFQSISAKETHAINSIT